MPDPKHHYGPILPEDTKEVREPETPPEFVEYVIIIGYFS